MSARLDAETKRLRALSLAQLADEAGAAESQTEASEGGGVGVLKTFGDVRGGNRAAAHAQIIARAVKISRNLKF